MKIAKYLLAVAASCMTVAPAMAASANPAARLSVAKSARAGSPVINDSKGVGGGGGTLFALAIAAGVAAIVIIAAINNDDDDNSDSN
ncbi:hypothetical protein [uncultured Sphingomonas sp.]|uniref:hypothetical protein n=1 Tax=uncultured Sphingomonas sp. TaxID=158754 RepID=UPI0035CBE0A2